MLKKRMNLTEYTDFGGKVSNLDLDETFDVSGGVNHGLGISKITDYGFNQYGDIMFMVDYYNGNSEILLGDFIETCVIVKIDCAYTK